MPKHKCAVLTCRNRTKFVFPKNEKMKKRWLEAIKRPDFQPKPGNGICEAHFQPEQIRSKIQEFGNVLLRTHLVKGSVPCVLPAEENEINHKRTNDIKKTSPIKINPLIRQVVIIKEEYDLDNNDNIDKKSDIRYNKLYNNCSRDSEHLVNGDISAREILENIYNEHCYYCPPMNDNESSQQNLICRYNIEQFKSDQKGLFFLTGLESYEQFLYIFKSLGSTLNNVNYTLDLKSQNEISSGDKLFLMLWKLKRNNPEFELGMHFGLTNVAVNVLFKKMIIHLASKWSSLDIWPTKELIEKYIPDNCKVHSTKLEEDETKLALYANVRANAEKHIQLFKILGKKMNPVYVSIATQITSVCIMLCNYKEIFNNCIPIN
ncbi:hypothetical protein TSAR_011980 [Trichomalopsis sarcophagae]|uniref:THAP-type domain-containing protein n=1 Tax=Trichomalopsis sarcophagae TaxID=543379 RepID=A0A232FI64_9HYME|nr:hypothetical protein TSAR_011980 [Trichomalopsis sarcophagae]